MATVVALASAPGEGGLAVIRLSGARAFAVASRVFEGLDFGPDMAARRAVYGILKHPRVGTTISKGESYTIDRAVALPFVGPHSYTGEDTVEFFCHGGRVVVRSVLAACRAAGAEPAPAGEFTRRAFLNGKLSLDQAEAVADLIHAQSEYGARAAVRQLVGGLDEQLVAIETPLLELLARIEGALEFVDEEEIGVDRAEIESTLDASLVQLGNLLAMAPAGRLLRDGIHVVLAGPPNVGKSSLFNALVQEERAIVDPEAGTTRDVVTGRRHRNQSLFVLHDTAGLREQPERVEKMGIARAWRQVAEADIVLAVSEVGGDVLTELGSTEKPVVRVMTKQDLAPDFPAPSGVVLVSSTTGFGLNDLWLAVDEVVSGFQLEEAMAQGVVLNERHLHKLQHCYTELLDLRRDLAREPLAEEVLGTLLASILCGLGEISGRVFTENLLENIFKRFCVGK